MKKKLAMVLGATIALQALFVGSASAAYSPKNDIRLNIKTGTNLFSGSKLGQTTFYLQESVHHTLTDSTGVEVNHSYIWIGIDGTYILALDPPQAMY